jgi:fatty-acyl-CoA synthase
MQTNTDVANSASGGPSAPLFQKLWARDQWPGLPPYRSILSPLMLLERTLHVFPEQPGVVDGDRRLTYG